METTLFFFVTLNYDNQCQPPDRYSGILFLPRRQGLGKLRNEGDGDGLSLGEDLPGVGVDHLDEDLSQLSGDEGFDAVPEVDVGGHPSVQDPLSGR